MYFRYKVTAQYKAGESEKIFFERNLLIVKALEKNSSDKFKLESGSIDMLVKLANEGFVAKAPAAVVEGEKVKLAEFVDQLAKIKANMEQIAAL